MTDPAQLSEHLHHVRQHLMDYAQRYARQPDDIRLLPVSKGHDAATLRAARNLGLDAFGESYVQEALGKMQALQGLGITWHFIGHIQSNKTRDIASHFDWVHSVDRLNIAERLSRQRPPALPPLNICLQINISEEASKSGIRLDELSALAQAVSRLPGLRLRGLMALPQASDDMAEQRRAFRQMRAAYDQLKRQGYALDTLSMGMSDDMEAAIAEGSTLLRIGTAIFGERAAKSSN